VFDSCGHTAGQHVTAIFTKLGLPDTPTDHRRVLTQLWG